MTEKDAAAPTTDPPVPPDPIYQKSYSVHMAIASIALVGTVALAIADEMFFRREYKGIQRQHKEVYSVYLNDLLAKRGSYETAIKSLEDFGKLDAALKAKQDELFEDRVKLQDEFAQLDREGATLSETLKDPNSKIAALVYDIEHHAHEEHAANGKDAKSAEGMRQEIEHVKATKISYKWKKPVRKNQTLERWTQDDVDAKKATPKMIGEPKPLDYDSEAAEGSGTIAELQTRFQAIVARKAELQDTIGKKLKPESEARRARDLWLRTNMGDIASFLDTESEAAGVAEARDAMKAKIAEVGAARYLRDYATTLDYVTIESIKKSVDDLPGDPARQGEIKQIHIKEANNAVDRCETCHVGTREPLPIRQDALREALQKAGWSEKRIEQQPLHLFTTHPRAAEIFGTHDPEKVGCSTCHNGNGVAINGVEQAHGFNKDWLYPLFAKENLEAGCIQCHQSDMHLASGPQFTAARETFLEKGCWGCHAYKGHDPEPEQINKLSARQRDIQRDIDVKSQQSVQVKSLGSSFDKGDAARFAADKAQQESLDFEVAKLRTEGIGVARQLAMRWQERIKVGPNLKDARAKLRPEILFDWVKDPSSVRPLTKMPTFRWDSDEEVKDVVAFIWQSALWTTENPTTKRSYPEYGALRLPSGGNAANGRALFLGSGKAGDSGLGCLSCHSINDETTNEVVGSTRATNLTNLGDKNNPAYVFRWISDPKHRIAAYSTKDKRDLPAAEAATADPATLVTAQATIMPDFRLSETDARDIATYLTSRKSGRWTTTPDWISDTARFERGKKLVLYQGCAGCHEIAGLEDEKGIGRDLTIEGSQALDRLDFGHLMIEAQRGHDPLAETGWKTQKDGVELFKDGAASLEPRKPGEHKSWFRPRGFFMHKLAKPDLYDTAKFLPDRFGRLRMPQFRWSAQEIHDLTTFLLGSVVPAVPESSRYNPGEEGQAIREGWWVVKKYNCNGCHQIEPGTTPDFWKMPAFAAMDPALPKRDLVLPPTLVGAGFRMRPEYIAAFLHDPSQGGGRDAPKSTRKHLTVRMPTFHLSDDEIAKLVRFFVAMAKQPPVYQPETVKALTPAEKSVAEQIFKSANCGQCHPSHVDGVPQFNPETKAPDLVYASRKLRPEWVHPWLQKPSALIPTTSMLEAFVRDPNTGRWYNDANATDYPDIAAYKGDHLDLMVRYLLTEYPRDPK